MNKEISDMHCKRLTEITNMTFEEFMLITDDYLDLLIETLPAEHIFELEFLVDRLVYLNDEDSKYNAMKLNNIKDIFDRR